MPSVGIPRSKSAGFMRGAPSAYTDAGPPLRVSACGLRARTASCEIVCGTSSEYTRASRTRRATSREYWPPQSGTRTAPSSDGAACRAAASPTVVSVGVLRDRDVVRVALAQPRSGDPHELRVLQVVDGRRAAVAHRLPEAADELVHDVLDRPLVRDAALDPLGDELVDVLDV